MSKIIDPSDMNIPSDVSINPETGNPNHRTTPIYKFKRCYARDGMVVVVGTVGKEDVERMITRREAIYRARAVNDMIPKANYSDEAAEYGRMVEEFMRAITKAKKQDGGKYKSTQVSMAMASTDPTKPLFADASGKTGPASPLIGEGGTA